MLEIVKLHKMGEEAVNLLRLPNTIRKMKSAFQTAIRKLDDAIIDETEKIDKFKLSISKGNADRITDLVSARLKIEELNHEIEVLQADYKSLFSKVKKEDPKNTNVEDELDAEEVK